MRRLEACVGSQSNEGGRGEAAEGGNVSLCLVCKGSWDWRGVMQDSEVLWLALRQAGAPSSRSLEGRPRHRAESAECASCEELLKENKTLARRATEESPGGIT
ncbi:hypothetical protein O3P69_010606 [Scylla paramamosain]|uniref:Uncharacterized protein n=1 Tax=Scylla paramamosain TaxID=85552 RepID=A0AAW0TH88_SCYPA